MIANIIFFILGANTGLFLYACIIAGARAESKLNKKEINEKVFKNTYKKEKHK